METFPFFFPFLIFRRGEDRPGSGRRRFRFFRALRKQHGRPQRTNQYADAQRYDDAVLVLARRFRDHHVGNRAVHREEFTEDSVRDSESVRQSEL